MSTLYSVVITSNDALSSELKVDTGSPQESLRSLSNYMDKLALGCSSGGASVDIQTGGTAASGTITLSSFVAGDTLTVGSQTFTSSATPSGNNQFLSTGGDTVVAAAATVKINAHPSLTDVASATSALGVITVTADKVGLVGNAIALAISAHGSVSGAVLTSGANATSHVMHAGL